MDDRDPEARPAGGATPEAPTRPHGGADGAKQEAGRRAGKRRKRRRGRKVFAKDGAGQGLARPADLPVQPQPPPFKPTTPQPQHLNVASRKPAHQYTAGQGGAFAALDLGTNNCRLLVAMPTGPGRFRVVDAFSRIVRLGESLSQTGRLSDAAMDRAVEALKVCASKLGQRTIRCQRLIATEACRAAANGEVFLERVRRETGLKLEIIDRMTEARLAVAGCESLVEPETEGVVLFDIGGGSSEIALIDLSGRRHPSLAANIVDWTSLPVGVVSLAERFGGRNVTRENFETMVGHVSEMIEAFPGRARLGKVAQSKRFHLLGTSGTVTTLAGVHLDLPRYERRRVDGLWMDAASVERMTDKLLSWDFEQRVSNPCIGADRADLVLAGCAILEAIRRMWPSERVRVADRGLREGILSEMMREAGVWRSHHRPRPAS